MTAAPLLQVEDVACVRGGRLLFEHVDLTLGAGDAAIVVGPNGVGKSSLIRIAAGLLRPTAGAVARSGTIALADEAAALDEKLMLHQALSFWASLDGSRADAACEKLGLLHLREVPVRMLSTGQRKRAALARVVASGAPLWLLDEPANGLDAEGQERLAALVAEHRGQGGAVLAASHLPLGLSDAQMLALG